MRGKEIAAFATQHNIKRIAVADLARFEERMESAYAGFFPAGRLPARSVIGVASLPRGALIAMDFTLYLG